MKNANQVSMTNTQNLEARQFNHWWVGNRSISLRLYRVLRNFSERNSIKLSPAVFTTIITVTIKQDDEIILRTIRLKKLGQMILRFNKHELKQVTESILQLTTIKLEQGGADI
jgi:hypothetical protein